MNNWFLFIGVIFVCSGFLMPLGVIMLVWYFIDLIFKKGAINSGTQYNDNTYNINNLNVNSNSGMIQTTLILQWNTCQKMSGRR